MTRTMACRTLGHRGREWDALVDAHRPSPFLRATWLDAIADPSTRIVLAVGDDGRLVGGVPFQLTRRRRQVVVQVAGAALAPDHVDLVCHPDDTDEVARVVVDWCLNEGLRRLDLHGVVANSHLAGVLGGAVEDQHESVAPWSALPGTFEEYWAARPGALRNTVRRATRRLERDGVGYERVPAADAALALDEYLDLHERRFGSTSAVLPMRDAFRRGARAALSTGLLVAHRMTDGERSVAIELWFESGGVTSFYQSGRDPDRVWDGAGSVLKSRVVEAAIERGFVEIDFLRGDEPYKRDWTDAVRDVRRITTRATRGERVRRAAVGPLLPVRRRLHSALAGTRAAAGRR